MEMSGHELRLDYLAFDAWKHENDNEELDQDDEDCQDPDLDAE